MLPDRLGRPAQIDKGRIMTQLGSPRQRLCLGLLMACFALISVSSAQAKIYNYCSGKTFENAARCYADAGARHHYNYNLSVTTAPSNSICAFIARTQNTLPWLVGSGCSKPEDQALKYEFCHGIVRRVYYAWAEHLNDSGPRQLGGQARSGADCSKFDKGLTSAALYESDSTDEEAFGGEDEEPPPALPSLMAGTFALHNLNSPFQTLAVGSARQLGAGIVMVPVVQGGLCFARQDASAAAVTCNSGAGTATAITVVKGGFAVWGGAPDSVTKVTAAFADGSVARIPIERNGYEAVFKTAPTAVHAE